MAEGRAFFQGREDVERRCGKEEDVALFVTLELVADVLGDGGVGGVAEVEDFVGGGAGVGGGGGGVVMEGWLLGFGVGGS